MTLDSGLELAPRFLDVKTIDGMRHRVRAIQIAALDERSAGGTVIEVIIRDRRRTLETETPYEEVAGAHARAIAEVYGEDGA